MLGRLFLQEDTQDCVFGRSRASLQTPVQFLQFVGMDGSSLPLHEEFDISDADRKNVDELVATVEAAIENADSHARNVILAAFAELVSRYLKDTTAKPAESTNPPIREIAS